jgi:hypothetical protein
MEHSGMRRRWWVAVVIPFFGLAAGVSLGAVTNLVNGAVSPFYFWAVMRWRVSEIWYLAVLQGMLEGGLLGLFFGVVVAISFAASTRLFGTLPLAIGALVRAVLVALCCWAVGGLLGLFLTSLSMDFWYPKGGLYSTSTMSQRLGYSWVGGSIWGAYAGTPAGAIFACVWLHLKWKRRPPVPAFEVLPAEEVMR